MISDEKIEEYRDVITYSENMNDRLGIDELLLLLSECIGDEKIDEVVNKYVDDFNQHAEIVMEQLKAIQRIKDIIKEIE